MLEKLVSVSRDAGRSAAQDSAIIMDSRMSEFKGKLTFVSDVNRFLQLP